MQERFIDTPEQMDRLADELTGVPWLVVDTEFLRDRTYYPQLCLIQMATDELAVCIDPLALENLAPLHKLLYDDRTTKVFHAGRQDLEIFLHLWNELPENLFDTQPAAALLGLGDQVGYGTLIQKLLGVNLAKDHARTDWSRRPLNQAQVRYALDDVIYLAQAYPALRRRLEALGRLDWLRPEFEALADPATYTLTDYDQWRRVKGWQRLDGPRLAALQHLAAWRERQARAADRPRRWVVKDDVLVEVARRMPRRMAELRRIRGLDGHLIQQHGPALLEAVATARTLPETEWPRPPVRPRPLTVEEEATLDILAGALRLLAEGAGLSPQAVASRKDLTALLRGDSGCALLQGWRRQLAGEPLLQLLRGERRLVIENGSPRLEG